MTIETIAGKQAQTIHIIFLLDESGSMATRADDVRGGFNAYVEKLRSDGNIYTLTAHKFGSTVRPLFASLPLSEVPALDRANYQPSDHTALYDAIGFALSEARHKLGADEKPYGTEPVIFVIMTDGYENASKEFSKEVIVARIKRREQAGNWTIVYSGADQDAWAVASGLGLHQGNVLSYTSGQTREAFQRLATSTSTTAGSGHISTRSFFSEK